MASDSTPATLTFPPDLVPELHALVLSNLPYFDLLSAKCVAKKWKAIIESDPALQVQTFKKASAVYRDNGLAYSERYTSREVQRESEPVVIHPALQRMRWGWGTPISKAQLCDQTVKSAGVLGDLATIPAVLTFKITLDEDEDSFSINVKNSQGITVLDVLSGIVKKTRKESFGDGFWNYEGFLSLKRTDTKLCALIDYTG